MITDAANNYFARRTKKGSFYITQLIDDEEIELRNFSGPSLKDTICHIKDIKFKRNYEIGNQIKIKILIKDDYQNKDGFSLYVNLGIRPKQQKKPSKKSGNKRKKPEMLGNQGKNIEEVPSTKPIIPIPVEKDNWERKTNKAWSEESVVHVEEIPTDDNDFYYKMYYNRDNINLQREFDKADFTNPVEAIEKTYKYSLGLVSMYALLQYRKDKENNLLDYIELDDEANTRKVYEEKKVIEIAAKSYSRGAFQLPEFIYKLKG